MPIAFTLDDPSPILEYVKVRLPFLKAEPFKLELEDFKLAESPLTRTDTKVLLKMEATDRLIEYLEANDWKIPLLGAYLPFEQPRKTGYESSLDRQSRRTKSPGPRGPRDRSRSAHSVQPRLEPPVGSLPRLTADQLAEQRRQMEAARAQWERDNAHLYKNVNRVEGTPYRAPTGPVTPLANQLLRQRSLASSGGAGPSGSAPRHDQAPPQGQQGQQYGQGQVRGPPQRLKVRMDVEYPPGSHEAAIQENRRAKKALKAQEAAARAQQAKLRLDNRFGSLAEPESTPK